MSLLNSWTSGDYPATSLAQLEQLSTETVRKDTRAVECLHGTDDPSGGSTASGARILGLTVLGREALIDQDAGTIVITLPKGTDVCAVALDITLSEGASSDPSSGQIVNLTAPLTITVRNGVDTRQYVISVVLERSISEKLWDEMLEESDVVDHQVSHGRGIH